MAKKSQSARLTYQHKESQGVNGIFGLEAKKHDSNTSKISHLAMETLKKLYPKLTFRYRKSVDKKEINEKLQNLDAYLGQTLFVENASIIPDGGIIEVKDDKGAWRVVLVSEAKHQGKDIENIIRGILVGTGKD